MRLATIRALAAVLLLAHFALGQTNPPKILQVYRDFVKPGAEAAVEKIEADAARICVELHCPHPYLTIESVNGPKEIWFLNAYDSQDEVKQVGDAYQKNAPLMSKLSDIVNRKRPLLRSESVNTFGTLRQEFSRGAPWTIGQGRFLVITMSKNRPKAQGTVYETEDGTFVALEATDTQKNTERLLHKSAEGKVFSIRPVLSLADNRWMTADPEFWSKSPH